MVPAQEDDACGVRDLEGVEVEEALDAEVAAVDVVPEEEVHIVVYRAAYFEKLHKIVLQRNIRISPKAANASTHILSMDIPAHYAHKQHLM